VTFACCAVCPAGQLHAGSGWAFLFCIRCCAFLVYIVGLPSSPAFFTAPVAALTAPAAAFNSPPATVPPLLRSFPFHSLAKRSALGENALSEGCGCRPSIDLMGWRDGGLVTTGSAAPAWASASTPYLVSLAGRHALFSTPPRRSPFCATLPSRFAAFGAYFARFRPAISALPPRHSLLYAARARTLEDTFSGCENAYWFVSSKRYSLPLIC
jgi:hypothetical protein